MKKQILVSAILFMTAIALYSQEEKEGNQSNVGLKAGYNLASVSFDGEGETGQRSGFHAGFYGESFVNRFVAIQIELQYSQQGYEIKSESSTFTQRVNYINAPLLLKIYPTSNFFLETGPQIGFAISHKEEFDSNFNLLDGEQELEPNKFDYGVNFGGGFKLNSGVSIGVRYHLGLGDIYDEGSPKNRVWQFSLGFDF